MEKKYSVWQKILYVFAGALLTGAMWRMRGTHGWGSEWGVFTVGLVLLVFIYAVFQRKTNASYLHIVAASTACMLTTPAWGTLLNQTSGFFEAHAIKETTACTPWSGVFIMLCLGFGMLPLYLFMVSRIFSKEEYSIWRYVIVLAVFFGAFYLSNATIAHPILKLVQPESVTAFEHQVGVLGINKSAYEIYMQHFANINWAKKIPYGRNYFTEITVISHAVAALVTALVVRFGFKDKAGGNITFWGCVAFSVGNTVANGFFVLKNTFGVEAHPWLDGAWSFWEYFTGFFAGLILMIVLFVVDGKTEDEGIKDEIFPALPDWLKDVVQCLFVFAFGFGMSLIRPVATRLDASDLFPIIAYAVGGVAVVVLAILMFVGKLPKMWQKDPNVFAPKLVTILFAAHVVYYMFVGYTAKCLPNILNHEAVQFFMYAVCPLFFAVYLPLNRKVLFKAKEKTDETENTVSE